MDAQSLRLLLVARAQLVSQRQAIANTLRGLLKAFGHVVRKGAGGLFARRVQEVCDGNPALCAIVKPMLAVRQNQREQIGVLDGQLLKRAKSDPAAQRLMSVPAVGVIVALAYVLIGGPSDPTPRDRPDHGVTWHCGLRFLRRIAYPAGQCRYQGKTPDERGTNFMLSMVRGIGPKDEIEAMMAAQMAAVHMTTMTFARRLVHVDNIPQQDSAERAFNKLARTFAMQVEALKRYRTGGEQKVTVQHVTVNEGGQAIVGSVSPQVGGREDARKS